MNFLELVQRARRKCRITGVGAQPPAVTGQNEEYSRLIDWTNEAWMDIQMTHPDWWWQRRHLTFPTVSGQPIYSLADLAISGTVTTMEGVADGAFTAARYGNWAKDRFRCNTTAQGYADEMQLDFIPSWEAYRDTYLLGNDRVVRTRPTAIALSPDQGLGLGYTPESGYTIGSTFFLKATEMVDATDIPAIPTEYHMIIVYRTMMLYGASESAPEVYDDGKFWFDDFMGRLEFQQMPQILSAPALA